MGCGSEWAVGVKQAKMIGGEKVFRSGSFLPAILFRLFSSGHLKQRAWSMVMMPRLSFSAVSFAERRPRSRLSCIDTGNT